MASITRERATDESPARRRRTVRSSPRGDRDLSRSVTADDASRSRQGPETGSQHPILRLQRSVGNQAVQRWLGHRDPPGPTAGQRDGANDGRHNPSEVEANRIAAQVVSANPARGTVGSHDVSVSGRSPISNTSLDASEAPGFAQEIRTSGGGKPLTPSDRSYFEPRFGRDLGGVRVHDGARAATLNRALDARAFTYGRDVYLGSGSHRDEPAARRWVLAHELTHVLQQEGGASPVVQRLDLLEDVGEYLAGARSSAYEWIIGQLRSVKDEAVGALRAWAATYTGARRTVADGLVSVVDGVAEILLRLCLAVTGLVSGFLSGIVDTVIGLIRLAIGVVQGLVLFLYGFIDGGERFDAWASDVLEMLASLPDALGALVDEWLEEFRTASEDRQTIMIGELTGRILSLIATYGIGAARAGSLPRLTVSVPRFTPATAQVGVRAAAAAGTAEIAVPAGALGGTGVAMSSIEGSRRASVRDRARREPGGERGPREPTPGPWRGRPRIEDGNLREGWRHIEGRHVTGRHPEGPGDLFASGTTRTQLQRAAEKIVERGVRISQQDRRIQVFERRMTINGQHDRVRVVVDSADGRVITMFPVRGG